MASTILVRVTLHAGMAALNKLSRKQARNASRNTVGSNSKSTHMVRKQRYICNHVSNLLLSGTSSPLAASSMDDHLLTQTEKNILKEIALGKTTKEIAAEKNLSFHTINSHRKNIFRKLGVNNVHEATKYAMRAGIVDLAEYYI